MLSRPPYAMAKMRNELVTMKPGGKQEHVDTIMVATNGEVWHDCGTTHEGNDGHGTRIRVASMMKGGLSKLGSLHQLH